MGRLVLAGLQPHRGCPLRSMFRAPGPEILPPFHSPPASNQPPAGVQADVTRLVEAGGGAPLEAQAEEGAAAAAAVAAALAGHAAALAAADHTTKCAALDSVPSSLLPALSKVADNFVLSGERLPSVCRAAAWRGAEWMGARVDPTHGSRCWAREA